MTITKLELQQALSARNEQLAAARLRIAELEGDVSALKSMIGQTEAALAVAVALHDKRVGDSRTPRYAPPAPSAQSLAFRQACAVAKAAALAGGHSVKVAS